MYLKNSHIAIMSKYHMAVNDVGGAYAALEQTLLSIPGSSSNSLVSSVLLKRHLFPARQAMFRSCRMPELIMFWAFVFPQARKSASPLTPLMSSRGSSFICDCSLSSASIFSMSSSNNSFCAHTLSYIVVRSFFITSFLSVKIYFLIIVIIKILYIVLRFLKSFSLLRILI